MAETFLLEIVTPTELLLSEQVDIFTAPGIEGEFGVLSGHTNYLAVLSPGELRYTQGGNETSLFVNGGYSEVSPDKTTILIEGAIPTSEINASEARSDLTAAEGELKELTEGEAGYREAKLRFDIAQAKVSFTEFKKGH